eukprot:scaffold1772_cov80-Cylindrotheca_fusiformis.AAC.11
MERNYNIVQQRRAMERNYNIVQRRRAVANYRTTIINTMPTPTARSSDGGVPPSCSMAYTPSRQEKMLKNFKFQTVLPDKSNTDPKVLRKQDNDDSSIDNDDETDSVIQLSAADKDEPFGLSLRFLLSTWRRPTKNDECVICLEGYEARQTICTATTTQCNHVFHQDCMEEWLKDHDNCPMCRVNLMYSPPS